MGRIRLRRRVGTVCKGEDAKDTSQPVPDAPQRSNHLLDIPWLGRWLEKKRDNRQNSFQLVTFHVPGLKRPMVQMGSGTLSHRLRATRARFCVIQIDGEHMVQDVVVIDRNGLEIRRNYDSKANSEGATKPGTQPADVR